MSTTIDVHGGINLLGTDSEVKNLELEELSDDPTNADAGRIYLNTTIARVAYAEGTNASPDTITRYVANTDDVNALAASTSSAMPTAITNLNSQIITLGQPVYGVGPTNVMLASASVNGEQLIVGLVASTSIDGSGGTGNMLSTGVLTATTIQWDAITGQNGGLTPNATYFLDIVSGNITATAPLDTALYLCSLGRALSSTAFSIQIARPIQL